MDSSRPASEGAEDCENQVTNGLRDHNHAFVMKQESTTASKAATARRIVDGRENTPIAISSSEECEQQQQQQQQVGEDTLEQVARLIDRLNVGIVAGSGEGSGQSNPSVTPKDNGLGVSTEAASSASSQTKQQIEATSEMLTARKSCDIHDIPSRRYFFSASSPSESKSVVTTIPYSPRVTPVARDTSSEPGGRSPSFTHRWNHMGTSFVPSTSPYGKVTAIRETSFDAHSPPAHKSRASASTGLTEYNRKTTISSVSSRTVSDEQSSAGGGSSRGGQQPFDYLPHVGSFSTVSGKSKDDNTAETAAASSEHQQIERGKSWVSAVVTDPDTDMKVLQNIDPDNTKSVSVAETSAMTTSASMLRGNGSCVSNSGSSVGNPSQSLRHIPIDIRPSSSYQLSMHSVNGENSLGKPPQTPRHIPVDISPSPSYAIQSVNRGSSMGKPPHTPRHVPVDINLSPSHQLSIQSVSCETSIQNPRQTPRHAPIDISPSPSCQLSIRSVKQETTPRIKQPIDCPTHNSTVDRTTQNIDDLSVGGPSATALDPSRGFVANFDEMVVPGNAASLEQNQENIPAIPRKPDPQTSHKKKVLSVGLKPDPDSYETNASSSKPDPETFSLLRRFPGDYDFSTTNSIVSNSDSTLKTERYSLASLVGDRGVVETNLHVLLDLDTADSTRESISASKVSPDGVNVNDRQNAFSPGTTSAAKCDRANKESEGGDGKYDDMLGDYHVHNASQALSPSEARDTLRADSAVSRGSEVRAVQGLAKRTEAENKNLHAAAGRSDEVQATDGLGAIKSFDGHDESLLLVDAPDGEKSSMNHNIDQVRLSFSEDLVDVPDIPSDALAAIAAYIDAKSNPMGEVRGQLVSHDVNIISSLDEGRPAKPMNEQKKSNFATQPPNDSDEGASASDRLKPFGDLSLEALVQYVNTIGKSQLPSEEVNTAIHLLISKTLSVRRDQLVGDDKADIELTEINIEALDPAQADGPTSNIEESRNSEGCDDPNAVERGLDQKILTSIDVYLENFFRIQTGKQSQDLLERESSRSLESTRKSAQPASSTATPDDNSMKSCDVPEKFRASLGLLIDILNREVELRTNIPVEAPRVDVSTLDSSGLSPVSEARNNSSAGDNDRKTTNILQEEASMKAGASEIYDICAPDAPADAPVPITRIETEFSGEFLHESASTVVLDEGAQEVACLADLTTFQASTTDATVMKTSLPPQGDRNDVMEFVYNGEERKLLKDTDKQCLSHEDDLKYEVSLERTEMVKSHNSDSTTDPLWNSESILRLTRILTGTSTPQGDEIRKIAHIARFSFPRIDGREPSAVAFSHIMTEASKVNLSLNIADRFLILAHAFCQEDGLKSIQSAPSDELIAGKSRSPLIGSSSLQSFIERLAELGETDPRFSFAHKKEKEHIGGFGILYDEGNDLAEEAAIEIDIDEQGSGYDSNWLDLLSSTCENGELSQFSLSEESDNELRESSHEKESEPSNHRLNRDINEFWKQQERKKIVKRFGYPVNSIAVYRENGFDRNLRDSNISLSSSGTIESIEHQWIHRRNMALWKKRSAAWMNLGDDRSLVGGTPEHIDAVAASVRLFTTGSMRHVRTKIPPCVQWRRAYKDRTEDHRGFTGVDVNSLILSSLSTGEEHYWDKIPWEHRSVKQRFLYDQSVSFCKNWFGVLIPSEGNRSVHEPVCCPRSMPMPVKAGEWIEEWYTQPWSEPLRMSPSHGASSSAAKSRRSFQTDLNVKSFPYEKVWEDVPECGVIRNVPLKIGERTSRLTPELTSSLRKSRWRKKFFPKGSFPY